MVRLCIAHYWCQLYYHLLLVVMLMVCIQYVLLYNACFFAVLVIMHYPGNACYPVYLFLVNSLLCGIRLIAASYVHNLSTKTAAATTTSSSGFVQSNSER